MDVHGDLCVAAKSGNLRVLHHLLASGEDFDGPLDDNGTTALMVAACEGHVMAVQALLAARADVNAVDFCGLTALKRAAQSGHAHVVQALLAAGADPDAVDGGGWTALMSAAARGHSVTVEVLIAAGADIGHANHRGGAALKVAAACHRTTVVTVLLAAGAAVDAVHEGESAFGAACKVGCLEIIAVMLPKCNAASLQEGLLAAVQNTHHNAAVLLLTELAVRDQATAVVAQVLHQEPSSVAFLSLAMLDAWTEATADVDAQLEATAEQQQELTQIACRMPHLAASLT